MTNSNINPWNITAYEELETLTKSSDTIYAEVAIRGQYIRILQGLVKVVGSFGLVDSVLESFGCLREITGEIVFTTFHEIYPALNDLGNLGKIGGKVMLHDCGYVSLGSLRHVGGNLNLRNTPIQDLGDLEYVGGYLPCPFPGRQIGFK